MPLLSKKGTDLCYFKSGNEAIKNANKGSTIIFGSTKEMWNSCYEMKKPAEFEINGQYRFLTPVAPYNVMNKY